MATIYSPFDEIVVHFLKMMIENRNFWPIYFLQSEDVYCVNPWKHFKTREPLILHDGRYFFVNRTENSGKTDGCESGCWRIMGLDRLIKLEKTGEILGFKKVFKFCEKEKPKQKPVFKALAKEKNRKEEEEDKRVWVMEEYRLASKWKQDYVICKIRLLKPNPLEFLLCNHIRSYWV